MKKYEKVFQKDYETWYGENEAYRKQVAEDPDRLGAIIKQRILLPMNSASRSYSRTAMRMLMAYIPALLSVKMGRSTSFIQEM